MDPHHAAAPLHEQHVAAAEKLLGALLAEDGAAVDPRGDLEADPCREVGLDGASDDVDGGPLRGHDDMDSRSPCHLRQPLNRRLDLLARNQHQVGDLVDHHDDERQGRQIKDLLFMDRFACFGIKSRLDTARQHLAFGPRLGDALVVAGNVADTELRHVAIAVLHFPNRPFQRRDRFCRLGDDRAQQMRDSVIDRQFQHLRVDKDHPAGLGRVPVEKRQDHRVDADRLSRAGGSGDKKMRHPCQIDDDGRAGDVLAERHRKVGIDVLPASMIEDFAKNDRLPVFVRKLDADHVLPRHHRNTDRYGAHRAGNIVGERDHTLRFRSRRRHKIVAGDNGTVP